MKRRGHSITRGRALRYARGSARRLLHHHLGHCQRHGHRVWSHSVSGLRTQRSHVRLAGADFGVAQEHNRATFVVMLRTGSTSSVSIRAKASIVLYRLEVSGFPVTRRRRNELRAILRSDMIRRTMRDKQVGQDIDDVGKSGSLVPSRRRPFPG